MKYAVIIEAGEHNYSAYVPDLPGCIATGKTLDEVKQAHPRGHRLSHRRPTGRGVTDPASHQSL